jgi:hypothetical protein
LRRVLKTIPAMATREQRGIAAAGWSAADLGATIHSLPYAPGGRTPAKNLSDPLEVSIGISPLDDEVSPLDIALLAQALD